MLLGPCSCSRCEQPVTSYNRSEHDGDADLLSVAPLQPVDQRLPMLTSILRHAPLALLLLRLYRIGCTTRLGTCRAFPQSSLHGLSILEADWSSWTPRQSQIEGPGFMAPAQDVPDQLVSRETCSRWDGEEIGAPGRIRTSDHLVRSQVLYPAELRARGERELSAASEKCQTRRCWVKTVSASDATARSVGPNEVAASLCGRGAAMASAEGFTASRTRAPRESMA